LYTRSVTQAPDALIKNGSPVFGTFAGAPASLDIRGVRRPFASMPLPPFVTNVTIRSNMAFMFNTGRFLCSVDLFGAYLFTFVEIVFWDTETHRKAAFRSLVGPRARFIPDSLRRGIIVSYNRKRKFKLSWNRKRGVVTFTCNIKGDSHRPDIQGTFSADLRAPAFGEITCVLPAPVMRRCRAVFRLTAPIKGAFNFITRGKRRGESKQKNQHSFSGGAAMFDMHRSYYKFRTKNEYAYGMGKPDHREVAFSLVSTSLEAANSGEYNENFLFVDGKLTLLPPVKITCPFGMANKWVIQDTESMVDLSFSPLASHTRIQSLTVLSARYDLIFGVFTGVLLTQDGAEVALKDFPGIVKKHLLRL
jgi:hypothetical protein